MPAIATPDRTDRQPQHGDVANSHISCGDGITRRAIPGKAALSLRDGAAVLKEGEGNNIWLALEDGLRIQFHKSSPANVYRPGDYWLVPARVATGGIIWPLSTAAKGRAAAWHRTSLRPARHRSFDRTASSRRRATAGSSSRCRWNFRPGLSLRQPVEMQSDCSIPRSASRDMRWLSGVTF